MKLRLPDRVLINNRPWKVVQDSKVSSGSFHYEDMKIRIGTLGNADREILTDFIHEITEISCVERGVRATKNVIQHEADDYVFFASHGAFCAVITDVSEILGNMMRLK